MHLLGFKRLRRLEAAMRPLGAFSEAGVHASPTASLSDRLGSADSKNSFELSPIYTTPLSAVR